MRQNKNIVCNSFIGQVYDSAHTINIRRKLKFYQIYVFCLDLEGYLVGLLTFTSQGNNEFFDVKFKTSEVETKTICIMKQTNIVVTNVFLNNIKQAGLPVTVIKLSPTQRVYFFTIP